MRSSDELREYSNTFVPSAKLLRIADHIDAEHEQFVSFYKRLEDATIKRKDVEIFGVEYMALPVDADGVPIRVGDVMVYAEGNTCPMKVVALVPPSVFLTDDGPRYADMCRHYHEPTVEDVLWEFGQGWHEQMNKPETFDIADYIERFAAKLQLKED